jgi:hypothetical protein
MNETMESHVWKCAIQGERVINCQKVVPSASASFPVRNRRSSSGRSLLCLPNKMNATASLMIWEDGVTAIFVFIKTKQSTAREYELSKLQSYFMSIHDKYISSIFSIS